MGAEKLDVAAWLEGLGLADCRDLFAQHDIDAAVLPDLTEADLQELGLTLGKRRRLLRAIAELSAPAAVTPPAAPGRGERRQVTVMFCDLVGSTRMAATRDPEDMQAILRRSLAAIATTVAPHGGHVAKYMGDGVLVYFGWPQGEEDSAANSARAGLAVIEAVAGVRVDDDRLSVRIGIATGLVVIGEILGEGMAREHVVTGPTANLAARLQAEAAPDTVLVSEATHRLMDKRFAVAAVGPLLLKGFDAPVPAFRVVAEQEPDNAPRLARPDGLLGRSTELAWLNARWQQAVEGSGCMVLLSAEAGMGKTHLAEAFAAGLAPSGASRLRLQCLQRRDSNALYPVVNALRHATGSVDGDAQASRQRNLQRLLSDVGIRSSGVEATFARLLGLDAASAPTPEFDPALRKQRTLADLTRFIVQMCRRQPLLLHLEDAHWSDPTTLELCNMIAAQLSPLPIMLLVTARPEFDHHWPPDAPAEVLALNRLSPDACRLLIARILDDDQLPAYVVRQIDARSDGIPLHVEELTRELIETRALTRDATGWHLDAAGAHLLSVPAALSDRLTARLDRLGWARPVAQAAAVVGREFSLALLQPLVDLPEHRLLDALGVLLDARLVSVEGPLAEGRFSFRHALFHDAAYAALLLSDRRQLHAIVADTLETHQAGAVDAQPDMLAHHLSEAGEHGRAVQWWRRSGRRNTEAAAYAEAVAQYERALLALAETPQDAARDRLEAQIRIEMLTALQATDGYTGDRVRANIDRAVTLSGDAGDQGLIAALAGQMSLAYGSCHADRAVAIGQQLIDAAERSGRTSYQLFARYMMGMALTGQGNLSRALAMLDAAIALSNGDSDADVRNQLTLDPRIAALAYKALVLEQMGRLEEAEALGRQMLSEAEAAGHLVTLGLAGTLHLSRQLLRHDLNGLGAAAGLLAGHAQRQESMPLQAVAGSVMGLLRARAMPDEGIFTAIRQTIHAIRASGWNLMVAWIGLLEAEVCLVHGRIGAARETLDQLAEVVRPRGHHFFMPELLRLQALAQLQEGHAAAAEQGLAEALAMARAQGARSAALHIANTLARLLAPDRPTEARMVLIDALDGFPESHPAPALADARTLMASLDRP